MHAKQNDPQVPCTEYSVPSTPYRVPKIPCMYTEQGARNTTTLYVFSHPGTHAKTELIVRGPHDNKLIIREDDEDLCTEYRVRSTLCGLRSSTLDAMHCVSQK